MIKRMLLKLLQLFDRMNKATSYLTRDTHIFCIRSIGHSIHNELNQTKETLSMNTAIDH